MCRDFCEDIADVLRVGAALEALATVWLLKG